MSMIRTLAVHLHWTRGEIQVSADYMLENESGELVVNRHGTMSSRIDLDLGLDEVLESTVSDVLEAARASVDEVEDLGGTRVDQQWTALVAEAQDLLSGPREVTPTVRDVELLKQMIYVLRGDVDPVERGGQPMGVLRQPGS